MGKLSEVLAINQNIGTASKPVITAMHRFVFEEDGDRNNRRRLRKFKGFTFKDDEPEFAAKMQYALRFTIGDLISICNVLGLEYAGNAEQIRERILRALMNIDTLRPIEDEDDMDDDDEKYDASVNESDDVVETDGDADGKEDEKVRSQAQGSDARPGRSYRRGNKHFMLSYRDVEDSVRSFNGTDSYPIKRWISDFEEAAVMFGWNDLQKVVFAKKSLKGVAKPFIQSESVIKTWKKL
ncbi:uncharacterized protein LOC143907622 [Temnothorax americanus]|uniref:uncharacterized protein LOC143907622 n=1 Tax=Temnothorax americanus TaxID=1964332 RepID=UPI004067730A